MRSSRRTRLYSVSFLFALHIALAAYINSTYISTIVSTRYIGIVYTTASVVTILSLISSGTLFARFGSYAVTKCAIGINALSLLALALSSNPVLIVFSFVVFLSSNTLAVLCIDLSIEHENHTTLIGTERGLYFTVTNIAWVIAPLLTAYIVQGGTAYTNIYAWSGALVVCTYALLTAAQKHTKTHTHYVRTSFSTLYTTLVKNRHIRAIFAVNFILQFFFVWMVVYTPIYLHTNMGLSWNALGAIFTIMLLPFVLFSLPTGILIDRYKTKKKTLLYTGVCIMTAATACIPFLHTQSILAWGLVLFFTRMGASIVETTADVYFFSHIHTEDASIVGAFRDMTPLAFIVAPLVGTIVLGYTGISSLFSILACSTIISIYFIPHLTHTHEHIPNANQ
jgi:MFS family permease